MFRLIQKNKYEQELDEANEEFDMDMTGREIQKLKQQRKQKFEQLQREQGYGPIKGEINSGIQQKLPENLLPHFTMCMVGKPASGKSTLMQQMLQDKELYGDKFDYTILISPSISKMDLDLPSEFQSYEFSFDFIFDAIYKINKRQLNIMQKYYMGTDRGDQSMKRRTQKQKEHKLNALTQHHLATRQFQPAQNISLQNMTLNNYVQMLQQIYKNRQPQHMLNISTMIDINQAKSQTAYHAGALGFLGSGSTRQQINKTNNTDNETRKQRNARLKQKVGLIQKHADEVHKLFKLHARSKSELERAHVNALILLDDVVGEIHNEQHSFPLAKLFLNRRHLIANGTVSIIVSTQKYTMIPARVRSSANWFLLFRLNPTDFEIAREDATAFSKKPWQDVLKYVFGQEILFENKKVSNIIETEHQIKGPKDYNYLSIHVDGNQNRLFKKDQQFIIN